MQKHVPNLLSFSRVIHQRLTEKPLNNHPSAAEPSIGAPFLDIEFDVSFYALESELRLNAPLQRYFHLLRATTATIERLQLHRILPFSDLTYLNSLPSRILTENLQFDRAYVGLGKIGQTILSNEEKLSRAWLSMDSILKSDGKRIGAALIFNGPLGAQPGLIDKRNKLLLDAVVFASQAEGSVFTSTLEGLANAVKLKAALRSIQERRENESQADLFQYSMGAM